MALRPPDLPGISLFAGAAGLDLAVTIAEPGYRTVCHVEREAGAAATLVARMEDKSLDPAPIWDDVASFDGAAWRGKVDIILAGYPCQGESNAGKRLGLDDPRWGWPHVSRIIREVRPPRVFLENVGSHLSRSFSTVASDLESMGARVAAGLFTAKEAGGSHDRERLFVLADLPSERGWAMATGHEGRGISDADRRVANLVDAANGRRDEHRASSDPIARSQAGRSDPSRADAASGELGNPDGQGRREAKQRQPHERRSNPPGSELADANGPGRQQITGSAYGDEAADEGWSTQHGYEFAGGSENVADAGGARLPDTEQRGQPRDEERGQADTGPTVAELRGTFPLAAPGPSDPRWGQILALDPALEPALCRMAHGMADRVDRLRLTGNGVFPLAGAFAYRTLSDALDQG